MAGTSDSPVFARVAQNTEHGGSNAGDKGENPFASATFRKASNCYYTGTKLASPALITSMQVEVGQLNLQLRYNLFASKGTFASTKGIQ